MPENNNTEKLTLPEGFLRIELHCQLGVFAFAPRHHSNIHPLSALWFFEANNWKLLQTQSYKVVIVYEDVQTNEQKEEVTAFDGVNMMPELSTYFDPEAANNLDFLYQSQS